MLKPVGILALDDITTPLAFAVQERVAAFHGVADLVQSRSVAGGELAPLIQSMHAQRQRPDSPLRLRTDVSNRELILLMLSAAGPARSTAIETAASIRELYEKRRLASFFTIEIICLLPEVADTTKPEDYAAAYALLKALSDDDAKPFDEIWLLDATNGQRMRFGALRDSLEIYADAIAGILTYEPELSGALPGIHPRGMAPVFSSFGSASLIFPRDVALQRLESRFAGELVRTQLLGGDAVPHAQLAAKQFVVREEFALPLSRIGLDAGQSLFRRFQPRTIVNDRTRSADELIAAVRNELHVFRDSTHLERLETLAKQGDQTAREAEALLTRTIDETLDRHGYDSSVRLLEALIDPLPELRVDAEIAPRNLVTEIRAATAALDMKLRFAANNAASDSARKRVRDLETLIQDQWLMADTLAPVHADEELEQFEREKASLLHQIPEILFAEERENNAARSAARDAEAARLSAETEAREQEMRELFAQLPRAEQALREALETRRSWLWQQLLVAVAAVAMVYAVPFAFGRLAGNVTRVTSVAGMVLGLIALFSGIRYLTQIAPLVRAARARLAEIRSRIGFADEAKNTAHDAELQFEYDVMHRRTTLRVLRLIHDAARNRLDALRARREELAALAASFVPLSIKPRGLSFPVIDDAEVDAYYERTAEDRKPFVREFPISRSASRTLALEELRERLSAYASTAFTAFRGLTLATAAASLTSESRLAQQLKRFLGGSAPLAEVRDDDLQANGAMQRDCTLWIDSSDAMWLAQLQRCFPDAHVKPAADPLRVHAVTRVLHYPGYVLGQIEYYRAQYEAAVTPECADTADLVPPELFLGPEVRAAYEQVLLARAFVLVTPRADGQLAMDDATLGSSHLDAARLLASPQSATSREQLEAALAARLEIAADVAGELRSLRQSEPLTPLDRKMLDGLLKKYAAVV
jgi:hypothetical protein